MLPMITKNADSRVTAMMTGWSFAAIESAVSLPTPLRPKTVSVMSGAAEQAREVHAEDRDDRRQRRTQRVTAPARVRAAGPSPARCA